MTQTIAPEATIEANNFANTALLSETAVRTLVSHQQTQYMSKRGSSALANMVAEAYVSIRQLLANAEAMTQAAILDEHGVAGATGKTSKFTPWIKVYWGEHDLTGKKFKDGNGDTRTVWVPDRNMEIYHHTMEELMARGVETADVQSVVDTIVRSGGASKMAKDRKADLSKKARDAAEPVTVNTRKVFVDNTDGPTLPIELALPKDAGEYLTLLVRKLDGQGYKVLGIADANAVKTLDRMADGQFDEIQQRIKARKDDEERAAREDAIRLEERERLVGGLDREQRLAIMAKVQAGFAKSAEQPADLSDLGGEAA